MKNKTLIFDLDSTLYYAGNQMEKLCYNKVMSFLIENMKVNKIQAMKLIKEFRKNIPLTKVNLLNMYATFRQILFLKIKSSRQF